MKLLCFYLPQFHRTPENDEWWGNGYTDWRAAQNAKPLFNGHNQPRIPLNNNYYDLAEESAETWKWQSRLALDYNIYGFCIYHYWFNGKKMLEKPLEILLQHKEIDIHYTLCWANASWKKNWYGSNKEILIEQCYGNRDDWSNHFFYMLQFFKDSRYIKIDNCPVLNVYMAHEIDCLDEMKKCWNELAKENGFPGIYIIAGNTADTIDENNNTIDAYYNFEPGHVFRQKYNRYYFKIFVWWKAKIIRLFSRLIKKKLYENKRSMKRVYKLILSENINIKKKVYLGICPDYDTTPRRQENGIVYIGGNPMLFEKVLYKLMCKSKEMGNDFIYINAWNEWGESAYLEPDNKYKYQYLESIKRAYNNFNKGSNKNL